MLLDRAAFSPISQTDGEVRLQMPKHDNGYVLIQIGSAAAEYLYVPPRLEDLPAGYITTIAGVGKYLRLEQPATRSMVSPWGLATAPNGDIFFAQATGQIFRVSFDGILHHVAGTLGPIDFQFLGDGGPAGDAVFIFPRSVARDGAGNLYVNDARDRIRKIDGNTGIITTIAGTGKLGFSGDGGAATKAEILEPTHLTCTPDGTVYFLDGNVRVRKVTTDGIISTVAGNGTVGESGDDGPAIDARLNVGDSDIGDLAVDADNNLFILETLGQRIRRVDAKTGIITTFVSQDPTGKALLRPRGIAVDSASNVYYTTFNNIARVDRSGRLLDWWGNGHGFSEDGTDAKQALIGNPYAIAVLPNGDIVYSDGSPTRLRKINLASGKLETVAGMGPNAIGIPGPALGAVFTTANDLAILPSGDLLYADGNWLYRIDRRSGAISIFAGTGMFSGGYEEISALTVGAAPVALDVDTQGTVYFADKQTIRSIDTNGIVHRIVGRPPNYTFAGDGGPARDAQLCQPFDVSHDTAGNLYVTDTNNNRVRRVDSRTGIINTIAGSGPSNGFENFGHGSFCGDGGPATSSCLNSPIAAAALDDGTVYINDFYNSASRMRKVAPDGTISSLRDWPLSMKLIVGPGQSIFGHGLSRIYRADNDRVRVLAGGSRQGFAGDGGPASAAILDIGNGELSFGLAIDDEGNLFFQANNRVRAIRYGAVLAPPNAKIEATASGSMIHTTVFDADGHTAPGVRVDFTTPISGASCTPASTFAITDTNGVGTVSCTPNCIAGTYSVTARPLTASSTASVSLTNVAGPCRRRAVRH